MGGSLSSLVDEALAKFITAESSKLDLPSGTYTATSVSLRPQALGDGLWLVGTVASLKGSTSVSGAMLAGVLGRAPSVKLVASGAELKVVTERPVEARTPSVVPEKAPDAPMPERIRKLLKNLHVELSSPVFILDIGGHKVRLHATSFKALPQAGRIPTMCSWSVEHRATNLCLDGDNICKLVDGAASLKLMLHSCQRAHLDVTFAAKADAHLKDAHVLALLDIVASAEALGAARESPGALGGGRGSDDDVQVSIGISKTFLRVDAYGGPLAVASIDGGTANVARSRCVVSIARAVVTPCGSPEAISDELVVRASLHGGRPTLEHSFPDAVTFPPWRSATDLLGADARFAAHRGRLAAICDGFEAVKVRPKKRPREGTAEDVSPVVKRRSAL